MCIVTGNAPPTDNITAFVVFSCPSQKIEFNSISSENSQFVNSKSWSLSENSSVTLIYVNILENQSKISFFTYFPTNFQICLDWKRKWHSNWWWWNMANQKKPINNWNGITKVDANEQRTYFTWNKANEIFTDSTSKPKFIECDRFLHMRGIQMSNYYQNSELICLRWKNTYAFFS